MNLKSGQNGTACLSGLLIHYFKPESWTFLIAVKMYQSFKQSPCTQLKSWRLDQFSHFLQVFLIATLLGEILSSEENSCSLRGWITNEKIWMDKGLFQRWVISETSEFPDVQRPTFIQVLFIETRNSFDLLFTSERRLFWLYTGFPCPFIKHKEGFMMGEIYST